MDVSEVRTRQVAGELFADVNELARFCGYANAGGVHLAVSQHTSHAERADHPSVDGYVSVELIGLEIERVKHFRPCVFNLRRYYEAITAKEPKQLNLELDDTEQVSFTLGFEDLLKAYDSKIITAQQLIEIMAIKED